MKRMWDLLSPEKSTENNPKQRILDGISSDSASKLVVKDAILENMSDKEESVTDERIKSLLRTQDTDSNVAVVHALFTLLVEHFEQKDTELMNKVTALHKQEIDSLRQENNQLHQDYKRLETRVLDLEMEKVSNVLMIHGIPESHTDLKAWFIAFCQEKLGFFPEDTMENSVLNAMRIGYKGGRPRVIRMVFESKLARDAIMGRRTRLKKTGIYFDEDFPPKVSMTRRRLRPIMVAAIKKNGQYKATLKGDKLLINGVLYGENDLQKLPIDLADAVHGCRIEKDYVAFFRKEGELSNHHPSPMVINKVPYSCNEQYYTRKMAMEFGDQEAEADIMNTRNPGKMLAIAKNIQGFDQEKWNTVSKPIMKEGLRAKFLQNQDCQDFLRNTGERRLVEANPNDKIWSCGLHMYHDDIADRAKWTGTNWLGDCLEEIRAELFT